MAVDVRYLPGQDPGEILAQVRAIPEIDVTRTFIHPPVTVSRATTPTCRRLREAVSRTTSGEVMSVGRDGASDAASFIEAGIPAVEFGPAGGGPPRPRGVGFGRLAGSAIGARSAISSARCRARLAQAAAGSARCGPSRGVGRDPAHRRGTLWRFLFAAVIVVGASAADDRGRRAAPVQAAGRRHLGPAAIQHARRSRCPLPASRRRSCIIGSDHRAGEPFSAANTDTMMLVRLNPQLLDDQRALDPARPAGADPRATASAKINAAYSLGGPDLLIKTIQPERLPGPEGQPHRRRQLRRLQRPGQRDRLRVRRRRPPLLQQHRLHRVLEHRHPARVSEAVRDRRAGLRPLPPHRLRHRPQRPPAGLHPLGQGPVQRGQAVRQPRPAAERSSASTPRPTRACTPPTG